MRRRAWPACAGQAGAGDGAVTTASSQAAGAWRRVQAPAPGRSWHAPLPGARTPSPPPPTAAGAPPPAAAGVWGGGGGPGLRAACVAGVEWLAPAPSGASASPPCCHSAGGWCLPPPPPPSPGMAARTAVTMAGQHGSTPPTNAGSRRGSARERSVMVRLRTLGRYPHTPRACTVMASCWQRAPAGVGHPRAAAGGALDCCGCRRGCVHWERRLRSMKPACLAVRRPGSRVGALARRPFDAVPLLGVPACGVGARRMGAHHTRPDRCMAPTTPPAGRQWGGCCMVCTASQQPTAGLRMLGLGASGLAAAAKKCELATATANGGRPPARPP